MSDYGAVAVQAVHKLREGVATSPRDAWEQAVAEIFPRSESMRVKACPRTTFLALCSLGAVVSIAPDVAPKESENVRYAREAFALLSDDPTYINKSPVELWQQIMRGSGKAYNQQMHVVLALAKAGLLKGCIS